ncbi:MAG: hypothetical protein ACKVT2_19720 [Saprospiraceae bacterium]
MEQLKKVRKVDAPPFLLTRIQAKIRASAAEKVPVSWNWAGALALSILLVLNISLFIGTGKTPGIDRTQSLAEGMNLQSNNQLYNE